MLSQPKRLATSATAELVGIRAGVELEVGLGIGVGVA